MLTDSTAIMALLGNQIIACFIILGTVAACFGWIWVSGVISAKLCGWQALVETFPMTENQPLGAIYKSQTGDIGRCRFRQGFNIQLTQKGVCVYPDFDRHTPGLIPWSSIRRVSISQRSICLTVEYEKHLELNLPSDALPIIQANVSPERFQKAAFPFAATKAAFKAVGGPRWLWPGKK